MEVVTFVELDVGDLTFRFTYPSEVVLFDSIPTLTGVRVSPALIDPGGSIGRREVITFNFDDFQHRFDSEPFEAGTFWTKFRARYPSLQGAEIRLIRGTTDQDIGDMEVRLYIVDKLQLSRGGASIQAKDALSVLYGMAAQAPLASSGELQSAITATSLSLTLSPSGIGNLEYPSVGKLCIGGTEIVSYTRSGDICTLASRGENVPAQAFEGGTKVQWVLVYENDTPSAIIYDLMTNYTNVDPSWITLADWELAVDDYIGRLYSTQITEPVAVETLLNELCVQVGLIIWWDAIAKQIRLKPLLPVAITDSVDDDIIVQDSLSIAEQPDKRISLVITYYAQKDPTKRLDEVSNYRRWAIKQADNANDYNQPAIRKIFSRWIPFDARPTAERLNDLMIARFRIPPRRFGFDLFRAAEALPTLGTGMSIEDWQLVDGDGVEVLVPAQIISESFDDTQTKYEAEEVLFSGDFTETDKQVVIDVDSYNVNLRDLYNNIYSAPADGDEINFVIESTANIGSTSVTAPALDVGTWPEAVTLNLTINGAVRGAGGRGGWTLVPTVVIPSPGGLAMYTRRAITVVNNGKIYGGGGGGGYGGNSAGGGGAGMTPGLGFPGHPLGYGGSSPGTVEAGGAGGTSGTPHGGNGGDPGEAGQTTSLRAGGAAGVAVDGDSYVTYSVEGDIRGGQIN